MPYISIFVMIHPSVASGGRDMPRPYPNALSLSRRVLRALVALNLVAGALIAALFVMSLVVPSWLTTALGGRLSDGGATLVLGMRAIMLIGVAAVPLTHVVLSRLLAIVETVRDGDPFVAENAARLQRIAWSVLGLASLHVAVVSIATSVSTPGFPIDIKWRFDVSRWVTVLLLFVLARVFEHGTRMRDDLEGTV
jgi:hypothetical protein